MMGWWVIEGLALGLCFPDLGGVLLWLIFAGVGLFTPLLLTMAFRLGLLRLAIRLDGRHTLASSRWTTVSRQLESCHGRSGVWCEPGGFGALTFAFLR